MARGIAPIIVVFPGSNQGAVSLENLAVCLFVWNDLIHKKKRPYGSEWRSR